MAGALRDLIVRGELAAGTPLVQRELARRLGVSQTPVRLGLSQLERDGLVEVAGNGRAFVSRMTREDFEEVYAARRALEGLAARRGAPNVDEERLARMRSVLGSLEPLASAGDVDGYLRGRWDFHAVCYEAARRPRLLAEVERLYWRSERYNRLVLSTRDRFRESIDNYRRFLIACADRDGRAAETAIEDSMRWAVDLVWHTLPEEGR